MIYRTVLGALLATTLAWGQQEWAAVRGLRPEAKVEVHAKGYPKERGRVVSVMEDRLTIRTGKGEQAYDRTAIKRVKVPSMGKRAVWGAIGVAGGLAAGGLACASCANEGHSEKRTQYMALGAAVGALAFLIPGYTTIYKAPGN